MLFGSFGRDENIVDVNERVWYVTQDFIHKALKILSRILQSKWATRKQKQPKGCYNRCLFYILRIHWNLVVPLQEVHRRNDRRLLEPSKRIMNVRQWKRSLFRDFVQFTEVGAIAPTSVFFPNKDNGGGVRTVRLSYATASNQFVCFSI